jgi:hypothetical protein
MSRCSLVLTAACLAALGMILTSVFTEFWSSETERAEYDRLGTLTLNVGMAPWSGASQDMRRILAALRGHQAPVQDARIEPNPPQLVSKAFRQARLALRPELASWRRAATQVRRQMVAMSAHR